MGLMVIRVGCPRIAGKIKLMVIYYWTLGAVG